MQQVVTILLVIGVLSSKSNPSSAFPTSKDAFHNADVVVVINGIPLNGGNGFPNELNAGTFRIGADFVTITLSTPGVLNIKGGDIQISGIPVNAATTVSGTASGLGNTYTNLSS